jgi:hypothetical protein
MNLFLFKEKTRLTNETIKESLLKLYPCKEDFTVVMSGKMSKKVNGLYVPETHEILLHNKNFTTDNALMYTAIHEFTHHVLLTEKGVKTTKCHSGIFWSLFYDFIDVAIKSGIYTRERSEATQQLIEEAKQLQKELLEVQKNLGNLLQKINKSCEENGERQEDVFESDLQLSRKKAKELMSMSASNTYFSDEVTMTVLTAKDVIEAKKAAAAGKTVEQVKAIAKRATAPDDDLESPESLAREKKRLECTITKLQDRLVQVEEALVSIQGE